MTDGFGSHRAYSTNGATRSLRRTHTLITWRTFNCAYSMIGVTRFFSTHLPRDKQFVFVLCSCVQHNSVTRVFIDTPTPSQLFFWSVCAYSTPTTFQFPCRKLIFREQPPDAFIFHPALGAISRRILELEPNDDPNIAWLFSHHGPSRP